MAFDEPYGTDEVDNPIEAPSDEGGSEPEPQQDVGEISTEPLYTVKVAGVEKEVPASELVAGYQRQQDYTVKTQALAEERRRLAQAEQLIQFLERNPEGTLTALAEQYGVSLGQQQVPERDEWDSGWDDEPAPQRPAADSDLQRKVADLEARLAERDRRDEAAQVQQEVNDLKSQYGDDVDVEAVMHHAVQKGFPSLRSAYADLYFDEVWNDWRESSTRRAKDERVVEAKREASVVNTGGARAGSATEVVERPKTVRDAYLLAKRGIRLDS